MSRPLQDQLPAGDRPACLSDDRPAGDPPTALNPDQLRRWAELIADGSSELPADLREAERNRLAAEVRQLLRARLIALMAEVIAADIERTPPVRAASETSSCKEAP